MDNELLALKFVWIIIISFFLMVVTFIHDGIKSKNTPSLIRINKYGIYFFHIFSFYWMSSFEHYMKSSWHKQIEIELSFRIKDYIMLRLAISYMRFHVSLFSAYYHKPFSLRHGDYIKNPKCIICSNSIDPEILDGDYTLLVCGKDCLDIHFKNKRYD